MIPTSVQKPENPLSLCPLPRQMLHLGSHPVAGVPPVVGSGVKPLGEAPLYEGRRLHWLPCVLNDKSFTGHDITPPPPHGAALSLRFGRDYNSYLDSATPLFKNLSSPVTCKGGSAHNRGFPSRAK
jgi:hypothetical protein